ncbi:FadR family transcriptional regulator [Hoyosella rhizosphaerae]|uniref:Transcriptional regulator, GntR n=1 Tax=Hoyosella rhizosphaerae TaxID=1755582 RepID=A0A916XFD5_9ACTN|nr:FadR/GntR family transcriptional regulator [Hoyosella rhizosphaerae]MBN4925967.1 FadR family transcriptional regulator [Hoyosella rhizosphaerae]GGC66576.1 putative transcriptional regulator, GntR [Hoyosella rhizosphaerae]
MQHVQRHSLITQVTDMLRQQITSGQWNVGERIPTEPELTELTGTGRNTVREAVQALVHAGMLERRQGSGTYVISASPVSGALSQHFAASAERDVLELRQALDVTAAALAARRRTPEDIEILTRLLHQRSELAAQGKQQESIDVDVQLHRAIVAASHNALYLEFYDSILPVISSAIYAHVQEHADEEDPHYDTEHARLVHAIIDGDPERASREAQLFLTSLLDQLEI